MLKSKFLGKMMVSLCLTTLLTQMDTTAQFYTPRYYVEPRKILTTAYCDYGITRSGELVHEGICAGKEEWLGKTVILYERNDDDSIGDMLGIFEVKDTGFGGDSDGDGIGSIQEGKVIDVYFETYERCEEWMKKTNGKCYFQLIDAEG